MLFRIQITMSKPLVSVILPAYNAEKYLSESINSILNQTFSNFELLIINDGSDDASEEVIFSMKDKRIVYMRNLNNQGIVKSLNKALYFSKGDFIARMDADDIAVSNRLERQVLFMQSNLHVDILGTLTIRIQETQQEDSSEAKTNVNILDNDLHKMYLLKGNTLNHPTVLLRSRKLREFNLYYDRTCLHAEDYKLWVDASLNNLIINTLNEPLLKYRIHENQVSNRSFNEQKLITSMIQKQLGCYYFEDLVNANSLHYLMLINNVPLRSDDDLSKCKKFVKKLLNANKENKLFPPDKFELLWSSLILFQEQNRM